MWKFRNEVGQSLVMVLVIITVLMIAVTSVILFARTDIQHSQKQINKNSAYYIAEAGLERAIQDVDASLAADADPATSFSDSNFNGGSYEVTLTPKTNASGENIGYTLLSTGTYKTETTKISAWVRQPLIYSMDALNYAIFAFGNATISTMSALLNLHYIQVNGDVHGNGLMKMTSTGLGAANPTITGNASSNLYGNIQVQGLSESKKIVRPIIPMPRFDFDSAREVAKREGIYVNGNVSGISLLGLGPSDMVIFVDGNMNLTGLDLLGISLSNRTIIVNGNFAGALDVGGGPFLDTGLNIIAKQNIQFTGATTGLQISGVLFAQGYNRYTNLPDPTKGNVATAGHLAVNGYVGGNQVTCGSGILSGILGLVTGNMVFTYNPDKINNMPSGVGFKAMHVEIVEQKVVP